MDSHGTNQQRTVSVNEAKDILDRCIVFIGNCDNKSSIVLSLVGIIVAIVFSDDRVAKYIAVSKTVFQFRHWFDCLFFIGGVAALLSLFAGIFSGWRGSSAAPAGIDGRRHRSHARRSECRCRKR